MYDKLTTCEKRQLVQKNVDKIPRVNTDEKTKGPEPLSGTNLLWISPCLPSGANHKRGPSGRSGGEHQALWSSGPRERRCKWQKPGQDRYLKSVCKCAP